MSDPRWTAETLELVASRGAGSCAAADILDALADAGLLVLVGGTVRHEWRFEYVDDDELMVSSRYFARPAPETLAQRPERSLRRRTVYMSPWIPDDSALPATSPVERGPAHDPPPSPS